MKKIYCLILLLPLLSLSSCVQEEENVFGESAAVRLQKAMDEYSALLAGASNGWLADYYPEADHAVGGYAMHWKFTADGKVSVACEIDTHKPAYTADTSTWEVIAGQGAILSFSSYNPVLHYFCEPVSSSDRDGMAGDYEFPFRSVSDDGNTVELKGRKKGNKLVLRRVTGSIDVESYLSSITKMADSVADYKSLLVLVNGDTLGSCAATGRVFNLSYRDNWSDKSEELKSLKLTYTFTSDGIRLYDTATLKGAVVQNFVWDGEADKYVCTDAGATGVVIQPNRLSYEAYLGDWKLSFLDFTDSEQVIDASLVAKEQNKSFTLVLPDYPDLPIEIGFNPKSGLSFDMQLLDTDTPDLYISVWMTSTNWYAYALEDAPDVGPAGMIGKWNLDDGGVREIEFIDNGKYAYSGDDPINGILPVYYYGGTTWDYFYDYYYDVYNNFFMIYNLKLTK
jgi:hypothetical protein